MTFKPIDYVIPGYITQGLTILASRPKSGKSWLMLDVCIAVASGRYPSGADPFRRRGRKAPYGGCILKRWH